MATPEIKRKLAAILSADVKGYSRLMGEDEAGTIRTLSAYKEVIADLIQQHHGRVVDAPGDNVLAEFGSVVDAVECAVETQKELKIRNADRPQNQKMEFRVGINLGDVVEEEGKIFGDGVNIASRLESLSEAGGICISGTAFDHIRNKLKLGYEYLGEQPVKNIALPVRVYQVLMEPEEAGKVIGEKRVKPRHWQSIAIGLVVILIVVVAAVVAWRLYFTPTPSDEVASQEKMAFPLPDVPSIAVMPFMNMSEDPKQEFLSDGITENIITALSKVPRLFVISRQSTFFYKGKTVKVKQVAEELGVQYVLEGSVQRSPDRIRINAQLINALTGRHIWAEKYDRDLKDIFALQDEITMKILTAVRVNLTEGEISSAFSKYFKGKQGFDCYLKLMEAVKHFDRHSIENNNVARRLNEEAISICPENPVGYAQLAYVYLWDIALGNTKSPRETLDKAGELAKKAVAIDDSMPIAHRGLSAVYMYKKECEKAIAEGERAVALDPSGSDSYFTHASTLLFAGWPEEAIPLFQKAIRLNPNASTDTFVFLGHAFRNAGRFEEAIPAYKKSLQRARDNVIAHIGLGSTYSLMGREEEARAEAEEILRINPKFSLDYFAKSATPYKHQSEVDKVVNALRKAGLPEKPSASIPPSPEVASQEKIRAPKSQKVSKPVTPPALKVEVASKEKMAFPLPDNPSIAVLPFVNMSGDPKQEFLSDGMTEEIITALSKLPGLFVIARTSTFTYKGKPVKVKQVSEELGVRYVLEGSVQRAADRIRINTQFIDALTGHHIWAERYDRDLKDIFALQDEITIRILTAVQVKLQGGDVSRWKTSGYGGKPNVDCYLKHMQAVGYSNRLNPADNNFARRMLEEVIATCPEHPMTYISLGYVCYFDYVLRNTRSPRETLEKGIELAQKALAMDDSLANAHGLLSRLYSHKGERDKAIAEGERAMSLDPNGWGVLTNYGNTLTEAGRPEEAIPLLQKVIRLNPLGPAYIYANLGRALQLTRRYEEAVSAFKVAIHRGPDTASHYAELAGAYVMMGSGEEAIPLLQKAIRLNPNAQAFTFANLGAAFRLAGRLEEAVSAYKEAIQRAPGLIPAHIGLGTTYSLMGREKEARAEAEEVLRINPKFSLDHFAKNEIFYRDQSEIDKIVNAMRKAGLK